MSERKKTILVVEDDNPISNSLKELLEDEGYHIEIAAHGGAALAYLMTHSPPDLILLDLMMPIVDGYQFRQIQQNLGLCLEVPVLIMSAAGNPLKKTAPLGHRGFIVKPIEIDTLLTNIATNL